MSEDHVSAEEVSTLIHELAVEFRKLLEKAKRERQRGSRKGSADVREEMEERNRQLQRIVNGLTVENMDLRGRLGRVEAEVLKLKETIEKLLS